MKEVKLKKGERSRLRIMDCAREMFNARGSSIKLSEIASELGESISYITNHFPTKDHLFVAMSREYTEKLSVLKGQMANEKLDLPIFAKYSSRIMDLQHQYRCVIIAAALSSRSQDMFYQHIQENYTDELKGIHTLLDTFIKVGTLKKDILKKRNEEIFVFQFTNLFTMWVASNEVYDIKAYRKMKPVYLQGIFNSFYPYLTENGIIQFLKINWNEL